MGLKTRLSEVTVNAEADTMADLLNDGYLRIYRGSQPESADVLITDQVMLAELRFNDPAFGPAIEGEILANPIIKAISAKAKGKASWFRCFMRDGVTPVMDGSAGVEDSGANLELKSVDIGVGMEVSVDSFRHKIEK